MLTLLSILILVHELGHFGVARLLGIKVEKFGFGLPFGPTLYQTKWGDTTVCIHSFLLGGYVSFPDDEPDSDLPEDDPGRISNRPVWQRFLVVSAGVTANAIIAYMLVLMVAGLSGSIPAGKYNVYAVGTEAGKEFSANKTGVQKNDKILFVNGVEINSPSMFIETAKRNKKFDGYATEDNIQSRLESIKQLNPQATANLKPSDIIPAGTKIILPEPLTEKPVAVEGDVFAMTSEYIPEGIHLTEQEQTLRNTLDNTKNFSSDGKTTMLSLAAATSDTIHPINIIVERNGEKIGLEPAYPNKDGIIGIKLSAEEITVPVTSPVMAFKASWDYLYRNTSYMVIGLGKIFTGQIPLKDLHGIVAITKIGGDIIEKSGIWSGILLTALISMDLAIINLLPIPALDGGHIMFLLIEKLIGRPVKQEVQEAFAKYGFMFLIGLMVFIIFNDIYALITNKL
jgi:regulator of sigma E protease